jgi:hypothetical protein
MPRISVTQLITREGKIQIDVTNTSGRAPPLSREHSASTDAADRVNAVQDHGAPCSLVVSLRSSHPQFFFYRGPQPKSVTSSVVTSPLRLLDGNGSGAGGTGRHHRRSGSALWGNAVVDPTILEVSQQTWKEHNFLPVAPDTSSSQRRSGSDATNTADNDHAVTTPLPPPGNAAVTANSDSRPLLVREEMADCVLLPGERRTFFMEVSNPSVLARLVAQKAVPAKAGNVWLQPHQLVQKDNVVGGGAAGASNSRLPPVTHLANGSEGDDDNPNALLRDVTDVFLVEGSSQGFPGNPSATTTSPAEAAGSLAHNGNDAYPPYPPPPYMSGSVQSDGTSATLPVFGKATSDRRNNGHTQQNGRSGDSLWDGERTDTDEYANSPSRQPLSIVGDSPTTHSSSLPNVHPHQQRMTGGQDSLRSSRDYVVPPLSRSASETTFSNGGGQSPPPSSAARREGAAVGPASHPYTPPPLSQRPVFYVYYRPLGNENKCVDHARKWIMKEQHTYRDWRESLVKTIVEHERKREHVWTVTEAQTTLPPQPRLEMRRILPPVLGELVRWRSDDGSSGCDSDAMRPSPITVSAFHYYFARLPGGAGSNRSSINRLSPSSSSSNTGTRHGAPEVPPSFAATRSNRVSKKAKKMFTEDRQGAGTVVMPLRVPTDTNSQISISPSLRRNSGTTPVKVPSSTAAGGGVTPPSSPQPPPQQQFQQQQQRGASQSSVNGIPLTPARILSHTDDDEETDYYRGSSTPSESHTQDDYVRRPRLHTGRGLALLDDSVTGPLSPSAYASSDAAAASSGDYPSSAADMKQCLLAPSCSGSRWSRTETLDPEAAELAARSPPPLHDSTLLSSSDTRHGLPSFPSTLENFRLGLGSGDRGSGAAGSTNADLVATPFSSATRQLGKSNSSTCLAGQLSEDISAAHANEATVRLREAEAEAEGSHPGSFVAHLLHSFCGRRDTKPENASNLDGDGVPPHTRDISSAPPQRVTYRRLTGVGNTSLTSSMAGELGSSSSSASFPASHQQQLCRLLDRSKEAKGQMVAAAMQLTEKARAVAVQVVDLLQQHGPTAVECLMTVLNFIEDNVFTPQNVKMMETVISPMVIIFAAIALLYLLLGGGGDGAFPLLYNGNL